MKERIKKHWQLILSTIFVFCCFAYITYLTPLAGDDWGYALNGLKGNPILTAVEFYFSWSGRFFSELWGFVVAPNKWLWNLLNPLLFSGIYVFLNILGNEKKSILGYLVSLLLVFFVSDNLRMETYSWIMGTTYVVPLCISLIYFVIVFYHCAKNLKWKKWEMMLCSFLNLYVCLCMENIAAVLILANILFVLYAVIRKEGWKEYLLPLLFSVVGFLVMRLSPGSAYRLSLDTRWLSMNLLEQITSNLPYFLRYTFYDNKYLVLGLGFLMMLVVAQKEKKINKRTVITVLLFGVCAFMLASNKFYSLSHLEILRFPNLYDTSLVSLFVNMLAWIFFIVYIFWFLIQYLADFEKEKALFFLLLAGASNIVMLVSPIFGSRSSLYFYYFGIVLTLIVLSQLEFDNRLLIIGNMFLCVILLFRVNGWMNKYQMVNEVQQDRMIKIQYYLDHPEEKEVWIPRMPIYTVHSADIEADDTYHMDVFKQYYGLQDDCTIYFYVEE